MSRVAKTFNRTTAHTTTADNSVAINLLFIADHRRTAKSNAAKQAPGTLTCGNITEAAGKDAT